MRADRLLSILLLLQVRRRLTARELAEQLEVSERTILRDMDALGAAGIPVIAERGAGGGWSLVEGYRTELTGLSESEAQALVVPGPPRLLADLRLDRAAEGALLKLLAALPAMVRRRADEARRKIHVDVSGWSATPEAVPCFQAVQEAVWRERQLQLTYERGFDGEPVERRVDPLGLVAKGSVWYLVAAVEGDVRTYRASRISTARVLDEPAARPPEGFDLAAFWERSAAEFKAAVPRFYATFRVHPEVLPRLYAAGRFSRIEKMGEVDGEGWTRVEMRFQFEEEAAEIALSFGPRLEVLEPQTVRDRVLELARGVLAFYSHAS